MRGTILGFDGSIGAILGEDGKRYSFILGEWRGPTAPAPRDAVDFVDNGSEAEQIYPFKGADLGSAIGNAVQSRLSAAEQALSQGDASQLLPRLKAALALRPQVILAMLILIATFGLTWLSVGGADLSLGGFVDMAGKVRAPLAESVAMMRQFSAGAGAASYGGQALAESQAALRTASLALTIIDFLWVLYLIPAGAALLLVLEYRQKRMRIVELVTGALAAVSLGATWAGRELLAKALSNEFGSAEAAVRSAVSLGWGDWIIGLAGVGLILTALGLLRRTPGL